MIRIAVGYSTADNDNALAHQRAPSPGYPQAVQQPAFPASSSQSTLERSPSLRQASGGQFGPPRPIAENNLLPEEHQQRILENRNSQFLNSQTVGFGAAPPPEKEKRGLRDKFFGHSSKQSQDQASSKNQAGIARSLSVSKKRESVPPELYYQKPGQGQFEGRSPYRRSANSSQNLLNTHTEEDEDSQHNIYNDPRFQSGQIGRAQV